MKKIREIRLMTRDFLRVAAGKDYFHQPQGLGGHFRDPRAYYNDFRGKVQWHGPYADGVPLLYVPSLDKQVAFPIMILQYGLGCVDRWLLDEDETCKPKIQSVTRWLLGAATDSGSMENYFPDMDPTIQFYSSNSCMAQGEALSFLTRVLDQALVSKDLMDRSSALLPKVFENMIQPVQVGGTALENNGGLYFLEVCRRDTPVILNGWIYALFGILDFARHSNDDRAWAKLRRSIDTLEGSLELFTTRSGWSYYNDQHRVASPFYHSVHIVLLEAMAKLFPSESLEFGRQRFCAGGHLINRLVFTLLKIKEKLKDTTSYTTSKAA